MKSFRGLLLGVFGLLATYGIGQTYTISGTVKDPSINDIVIGARVKLKEVKGAFAVTDINGQFKILIDTSGVFTLTCEAFSYGLYERKLVVDGNVTTNVEMRAEVNEIEEVVVEIENYKENFESTQVGKLELSKEEVEMLPAVMGEADIMKTIQLLPGVQSGGEGVSGLYVRGGGPDQNLVLFDNATIYNTGHLFGFFSVFNNDALNGVELYKGSMPAYFGGRLSSVLDFTSLEPSYDDYTVEGGVGLISSRLTLSGPIKKGKTAAFISGRRTYIDVLTDPFLRDTETGGIPYYFYDLNGKIEHKFSDKDKIYVSGYYGRDIADFELFSGRFIADFSWGNSVGSIGWNHLFSDKMVLDVNATITDYKFQLNSRFDSVKNSYTSSIRDYGFKSDLKYFINEKNKLRMGVEAIYHDITPKEDKIEIGGSNSIDASSDILNPKLYGLETAVYADHQIDLTNNLRVQAGLRYSMYSQFGSYNAVQEEGTLRDTIPFAAGSNVVTYGGLEPRIFGRYTLDSSSSVKASAVRVNQYMHLLSLTGNSLPFDIWVPSTKTIKPQRGWQYSAGYFRNFLSDTLVSSVEVFYRNVSNQIEYREDFVPTNRSNLEEELVFGDGYAYGIELYLKKTYGRLKGWIGYTYSRTMRKFPDLNGGDKFPARYDRRHDLSLVGIYKLNDRWTLSGNFVYGTGLSLTMQEGKYLINGEVVNQYGPRNGYRMPAYHRLDLAATYEKKREDRRFQSSWSFSVYNIYNRKNPYLIYIDAEGDPSAGELKPQAKLLYIFPILPSVTWNFKF